jgi:hypothetical protein
MAASKKSKTKKNDSPKPHVCKECGQDVSYVVAADYKPTEATLEAVRKMAPGERNQAIAREIIHILVPTKNTKYTVNTLAYLAVSPGQRETKWTKAQIERMARALAPFSIVAQKEIRIYPTWPRHIMT